MEITLYFDQYAELLNIPFLQAIYRLIFWYFGWLPFAIIFLWLAKELWVNWRAELWSAKQTYVLLAIDVPNNNEQSPKAVENFFAYLHAAQSTPNLIEKYWEGKYQQSFSFEIVSIEGYIQFLVRTPEPFKEFVMTGIYAQYPDAEIAVVNDYVDDIPTRYPDLDQDIWGSEFILVAPDPLPIKQYKEFEHILGAPEVTYRDTMANLMDVMSSMGVGEQIWFQIITTPVNFDWLKKFGKFTDKLVGIKPKSSFEKSLLGMSLTGIGGIVAGLNPWDVKLDPKKVDKEKEVSWMNMNPKLKKQVEAVQMKASKIAYNIKIRAIYLADKNVMNKAKGVNGLIGYMKQFTGLDLNSFMPDVKKTATSTAYLSATPRLNERKKRIVRAYKVRSGWLGRTPYILNIEELATIWHFPLDMVVKAPLLQRASSRKVEAPMSLPFGESGTGMFDAQVEPIFDANYTIPQPEVKEKITKTADVKDSGVSKDDKTEDFIEFLEDEIADENKGEAPENLPFV